MLMYMRTNIELNDQLLAEAQKHSKARTKRALVEEALAAFVAMKAEERRRSTYKERLDSLRHRTKAVRLQSDTRDILRKDRDSR
jgi:Arc/MetJ family transcription regulator